MPELKTADFSYDLPDELIAQQPPETRGQSRLLVVHKTTGALKDKLYGDIAGCIDPGDVVVLNDTKVLPARLQVTKAKNGAARELILLEQHGSGDWMRHKVLYRRKLVPREILRASDGTEIIVEEVLGDGIAIVSSTVNLLELAIRLGSVPLPPYMHRAATSEDSVRYQTVWAKHLGSVAAPTPSLNMTESFIESLQAKGAIICYATLHVGLGTFLPIRSENLNSHTMHKEYFEIPKATLTAIRAAKMNGSQILAVGTTITRTLEYAADQIMSGTNDSLHGEADIFIYPGYTFKLVDSLLTNFHAPRSTVLMLASAFAGWDNLVGAYEHAIKEQYQFLSYGDSMLITAKDVV